jgi:acyl-coenzyme A thioesterase PaaI-like protein
MDYEALRAGLQQAIPYNGHLGLEVVEVGEGRGVVRLPDSEFLRNHVGSQHAGALFSAGEAASGAAFVGAFAQHMAAITPLARSAAIDYRRLARGPITANASLDEDAGSLLERLDSAGKVEFKVEVELVDAGGTGVAHMSVDWHVRRNGSG